MSSSQQSIVADDGSRYFINDAKRLSLLKLLSFHFPRARSVEETLYKNPLPCVCQLVGYPSEDEESRKIREHNRKARQQQQQQQTSSSNSNNLNSAILSDLAQDEAFRAHAGVLNIPETNLCIFFLQETPYNPHQQTTMQVLLEGATAQAGSPTSGSPSRNMSPHHSHQRGGGGSSTATFSQLNSLTATSAGLGNTTMINSSPSSNQNQNQQQQILYDLEPIALSELHEKKLQERKGKALAVWSNSGDDRIHFVQLAGLVGSAIIPSRSNTENRLASPARTSSSSPGGRTQNRVTMASRSSSSPGGQNQKQQQQQYQIHQSPSVTTKSFLGLVHNHVNSVIDTTYFNVNVNNNSSSGGNTSGSALPSSISHIAATASTMFSGRVNASSQKNTEHRPAISLPDGHVANSLELWRLSVNRTLADLDAETAAAETMIREWTQQIRTVVNQKSDYFSGWQDATITSSLSAWVERLSCLTDLLVSVRDDPQVKSTLEFLQRGGSTQQEEQFRRAQDDLVKEIAILHSLILHIEPCREVAEELQSDDYFTVVSAFPKVIHMISLAWCHFVDFPRDALDFLLVTSLRLLLRSCVRRISPAHMWGASRSTMLSIFDEVEGIIDQARALLSTYENHISSILPAGRTWKLDSAIQALHKINQEADAQLRITLHIAPLSSSSSNINTANSAQENSSSSSNKQQQKQRNLEHDRSSEFIHFSSVIEACDLLSRELSTLRLVFQILVGMNSIEQLFFDGWRAQALQETLDTIVARFRKSVYERVGVTLVPPRGEFCCGVPPSWRDSIDTTIAEFDKSFGLLLNHAVKDVVGSSHMSRDLLCQLKPITENLTFFSSPRQIFVRALPSLLQKMRQELIENEENFEAHATPRGHIPKSFSAELRWTRALHSVVQSNFDTVKKLDRDAFALLDGSKFLIKVRTTLQKIQQHEQFLIQQWHDLEAQVTKLDAFQFPMLEVDVRDPNCMYVPRIYDQANNVVVIPNVDDEVISSYLPVVRVHIDALCYRVMSESVSLKKMGVPPNDPSSIVAQSAEEILRTFAMLRGAALIYHEISKRMNPPQAHLLYKALQPVQALVEEGKRLPWNFLGREDFARRFYNAVFRLNGVLKYIQGNERLFREILVAWKHNLHQVWDFACPTPGGRTQQILMNICNAFAFASSKSDDEDDEQTLGRSLFLARKYLRLWRNKIKLTITSAWDLLTQYKRVRYMLDFSRKSAQVEEDDGMWMQYLQYIESSFEHGIIEAVARGLEALVGHVDSVRHISGKVSLVTMREAEASDRPLLETQLVLNRREADFQPSISEATLESVQGRLFVHWHGLVAMSKAMPRFVDGDSTFFTCLAHSPRIHELRRDLVQLTSLSLKELDNLRAEWTKFSFMWKEKAETFVEQLFKGRITEFDSEAIIKSLSDASDSSGSFGIIHNFFLRASAARKLRHEQRKRRERQLNQTGTIASDFGSTMNNTMTMNTEDDNNNIEDADDENGNTLVAPRWDHIDAFDAKHAEREHRQKRVKEFHEKCLRHSPTLAQIEAFISYFERVREYIRETPVRVCIGCIRIDCAPLRTKALQLARLWRECFLKSLQAKVGNTLDDVTRFVKFLETHITSINVQSTKDLVNVMSALQQYEARRDYHDVLIQPLKEIISVLRRHGLKVSDEVAREVEKVAILWRDTKRACTRAADSISMMQHNQVKRVRELDDVLQRQIEEYVSGGFLEDAPFESASIPPAEAYDRIRWVQLQLAQFEDHILRMRPLQALFGVAPMSSNVLLSAKQDLVMLKHLWDNIASIHYYFETWGNRSLLAINVDEMNEDLRQYQVCLRALDKRVKTWKAFEEIVRAVKNWCAVVPLARTLRHQSVRVRHLVQLTKLPGSQDLFIKESTLDLSTRDNLTLNRMLAANFAQNADQVTAIVERATREARTEAQLEQLRKDWCQRHLGWSKKSVKPAHGGMRLIVIPDEVAIATEDDMQLVQRMGSSRAVDSDISNAVARFTAALVGVEAMLNAIREVLQRWSVLVNVFLDSDDIQTQLPQVYTTFFRAHNTFVHLLKDLYARKRNVLELACGTSDPVRDRFSGGVSGSEHHNIMALNNNNNSSSPSTSQHQSSSMLIGTRLLNLADVFASCHHSLSSFIDEKRKSFPRFCFLPEDDLLDVLSFGGDAESVLRCSNLYATKMFPGIKNWKIKPEGGSGGDTPASSSYSPTPSTSKTATLSMPVPLQQQQEPNAIITSLFGIGEDSLQLHQPVECSGKPDSWLADILRSMQLTIAYNMGITLSAALSASTFSPATDLHHHQSKSSSNNNNQQKSSSSSSSAAARNSSQQLYWMHQQSCGQIVLIVRRLQWTTEAALAIRDMQSVSSSSSPGMDVGVGGSRGMKTVLMKSESLLLEMIQLIRDGKQNSPAARTKWMNLISNEVFLRDQTSALVNNRVDSEQHHMWRLNPKHRLGRHVETSPYGSNADFISSHQQQQNSKSSGSNSKTNNKSSKKSAGPGSNNNNNNNQLSSSDSAAVQSLRHWNHIHELTGGALQLEVCDVAVPFGYEFLGSVMRLVTTPLTNRITITFLQALHLRLGGSAGGPAGTGKTETTKDIAAHCGKACLVYNCSSDMSSSVFRLTFMGVAASGTWCCLDEFNRVAVEVLSVLATQLRSIYDALRHFGAMVTNAGAIGTFTFCGRENCQIDSSCGIFTTMNPGYAGRAELPASLKAMFRPVTVFAPDLLYICENVLMAEGFVTARVLARKLLTIFETSQVTMSPQQHYDWGLRSLKPLLTFAGNLRRARHALALQQQQMASSHNSNSGNPQNSNNTGNNNNNSNTNNINSQAGAIESDTLIKALFEFIMPRLLPADTPTFQGIVWDAFADRRAGVVVGAAGDNVRSPIDEACRVASAALQLSADDFAVSRATQLLQLLQARHSVFLLGPTFSGKSCTWKLLQEALRKCGSRVANFILNPKTIPAAELYGFFAPGSKEWRDGLLTSVLRKYEADTLLETSAAAFSRSAPGDGRKNSVVSNDATDHEHNKRRNSSNHHQQQPSFIKAGPGANIPPEFRWITLDGDLDTHWVETMNSVMDDNKLLTLVNQERIQLHSSARLLFEINSVVNTTPATVSRAGVLYCSDKDVTWQACVSAIFDGVPGQATVIQLCEKYLPALLDFVSPHNANGVQFAIPSVTSVQLVVRGCRLLKEVMRFHLFSGVGPTNAGASSEIWKSADFMNLMASDVASSSNPNSSSSSNDHLPNQTHQFHHAALDKRTISSLFLFSFVWAFGGSLIDTNECRNRFDAWWRQQWKSADTASVRALPEQGTVFDLCYCPEKKEFVFWNDKDAPSPPSYLDAPPATSNSTTTAKQSNKLHHQMSSHNNSNNSDDKIPPLHSVSFERAVDFFSRVTSPNKMPILFVGSTGAGKTRKIEQCISDGVWNGSHVSKWYFTAVTDLSSVRRLFERSMDKKTNRCLMPKEGARAAVICIEDINMPAPDAVGTKAATELLRSVLDYGYWHDRAAASWYSVAAENVLPVGTINLDRTPPAQLKAEDCLSRFISRFLVFTAPQPCSAARSAYLQSLIPQSFVDVNLAAPLLKCLVDLSDMMQRRFGATYRTYHRTFSFATAIRLATSVLTTIDSDAAWRAILCGSPHYPASLVRERLGNLIVNEAVRTYADSAETYDDYRSMCATIQNTVTTQISECCQTDETTAYAIRLFNILEPVPEIPRSSGFGSASASLNFGHQSTMMMNTNTASNNTTSNTALVPTRPTRVINKITLNELRMSFEKALHEARIRRDENVQGLDVVLFDEFVLLTHSLARMFDSSIVSSDSYVLFLGCGGSGKKSAIRLAAATLELGIVQPPVPSVKDGGNTLEDAINSPFMDTMRNAMMTAGINYEGIVVLLTDVHLSSNIVLQSMHELLLTGIAEVMFDGPRRDDVCRRLTMDARSAGIDASNPTLVWSFFRKRCREKLRVVFSVTAGDTLRSAIRRFPSLKTSTVAVWSRPWQEDTLISISKFHISKSNERFTAGECDPIDSKQIEIAAIVLQKMYQAVELASERLDSKKATSLRPTPGIFMQFLKTFVIQYESRYTTLRQMTRRYSGGVKQISTAAVESTTMQDVIAEQQIVAEAKRKEAEKILESLQSRRAIVHSETREAETEERSAQSVLVDVTRRREECEHELMKAEPNLLKAAAALDTLNKSNIAELRTFKNPPEDVKKVLECVIILLSNGQNKDHSWAAAQRAMIRIDVFLDNLKNYDKDGMASSILDQLNPIITSPNFRSEIIVTKSLAAGGMCEWVLNIVEYHKIYCAIVPKRNALKDAQKKLDEANKRVTIVRNKLSKARQNMMELEEQYSKADNEQRKVADRVTALATGISLAKRFVSALSSESSRWNDEAGRVGNLFRFVLGDAMFAAALLCLLSSFPLTLRERILSSWAETASTHLVEVSSDGLEPSKCFTDDVESAVWRSEGLPIDTASRQNACVLKSGQRVCLCVDPQKQAVAWLRVHFDRVLKKRVQESRAAAAALDPRHAKASMTSSEQASSNNNNKSSSSSSLAPPHVNEVRLSDSERTISDALRKSGARGDVLLIDITGATSFPPSLTHMIRWLNKNEHDDPLFSISGKRRITWPDGNATDVDKNFDLFLICQSDWPSLSNEMLSIVQLVDFSITEAALEEQLLTIAVQEIRPDTDEKLAELTHSITQGKEELKSLEDQLIRSIAKAREAADPNAPIESRLLKAQTVERAEQSITTAKKIKAMVENNEKQREVMTALKEELRPVAARGALFYFVFAELRHLEPLYSRSLDWFRTTFRRGLVPRTTPLLGGGAAAGNHNSNNNHDRAGDDDDEGSTGGSRMYGGTRGSGDGATDEETARAKIMKLLRQTTLYLLRVANRGLRDQHRTLLSVSLALKILQKEGNLEHNQLNFLFHGSAAIDVASTDCPVSWLSDQQWRDVEYLSLHVSGFEKFVTDFETSSKRWKSWIQSPVPEQLRMPGDWREAGWLAMPIVIKMFRPDRFGAAMKYTVQQALGPDFISKQSSSLSEVLTDAEATSPVLYIVFPGSDPLQELEDLSKRSGVQFRHMSLGEGQEEPALNAVETAMKNGNWILLQNIHLLPRWLQTLDAYLEVNMRSQDLTSVSSSSGGAAENFRLLMTTELNVDPHASPIPSRLIQRCHALVAEPPVGIQANFTAALSCFTPQQVAQGRMQDYKQLFMSMCLFHAIAVGRHRFGPLGWSGKYGFGASDLRVSINLIYHEMQAVANSASSSSATVQVISPSWDDLDFLIAEVMYGGHITDVHDRRLCRTLTNTFISEEALIPGLQIMPNLVLPVLSTWGEMVQFAREQFPEETPEMCGVHQNADALALSAAGQELWRGMRSLHQSASAMMQEQVTASTHVSQLDPHDAMVAQVDEVLDRVARAPDLGNLIMMMAPMVGRSSSSSSSPARSSSSPSANNSNNNVPPLLSFIFQEITRLHNLIQVIEKDCEELQASFTGQIASNERLEQLMAQLTLLEIPPSWKSHSFPTLRGLRSWLDNIAERGKALEQSATETHQLGVPRCIWLGGLFAPAAVAKCALRLHAARTGASIESLGLEVEVTRRTDPEGIMPSREGIFVRGLLLEGARWDMNNHVLADDIPLQHETPLPILLLKAGPRRDQDSSGGAGGDGGGKRGGGGSSSGISSIIGGPMVVHQYQCPLYFTHTRGVSQHVFDFKLPSIDPVSKWIMRGTCAVLEPPSSNF